MTTIYTDRDAELAELEGCSVAVVGYGNQGRSWALNLRDSGLDPRVCVRADASREQAETEKYILDRQRLTSTQVTQTAMAQRDADKARADGRAYEIKVQGEAQAEAIRIMGEALAKHPLVVEYKKVERWGGTFPTTFMGGDAGANTLWSLPGTGRAPVGATVPAKQ